MTRLENGEKGERTPDGKFAPGAPAGPGRPKGYRSALAKALDEIPEADVKAIRDRMIESAKGGDNQAAKLILDRHWPAPKGRPVVFELAGAETAADIPKAIGSILAAVASGDLSPEEGASIAGIVELHRKGIETVDHEARLARLEKSKGKT